MVDGTRDAFYRPPAQLPDSGATGRKRQHLHATGAGTIGQTGDLQDLPPLNQNEDHGPAPGGGNAPPGAPELPQPRQQFTATELSLLVAALISKMDDAQSSTEQNGLQLDDTQRQEAYKNSNEQIAKAAQKLAEAKHKQKVLGPLMTIAKVFASIAAIALTITTAGMAAPLAIALIAYTIVDTSLTIADSISKAAGGPPLGLGDLLQEGFTAAAKKGGASDSEAATIGKWCAFGVQAAIAILTIAVSVKNIVSLARDSTRVAGGLAAKLSPAAFKATKVTGIACQGMSGATNVSAGGMRIAVAVNTYDADKANADKASYDAAAAALTEMIRNTLDRLQQIAMDLSSGMQSTAESVSNVGKTNLAIAGGNSMV